MQYLYVDVGKINGECVVAKVSGTQFLLDKLKDKMDECKFRPGERVEAKFEGDYCYGTIKELTANGEYKVKYSDRDVKVCQACDIKAENGSESVNFTTEKDFVRALIKALATVAKPPVQEPAAEEPVAEEASQADSSPEEDPSEEPATVEPAAESKIRITDSLEELVEENRKKGIKTETANLKSNRLVAKALKAQGIRVIRPRRRRKKRKTPKPQDKTEIPRRRRVIVNRFKTRPGDPPTLVRLLREIEKANGMVSYD